MSVLPHCLQAPSRPVPAMQHRLHSLPVVTGPSLRPVLPVSRRRVPGPSRAMPSTDPQAEDFAEMDDATKRWGKQVREGKVKSINTKSAGDMIKGEWTMLDVRPREERDVAAVEGAVAVPLFVVDKEVSPGAFLKKAMAFTAMGGWWEGGTHMIPNFSFISEVQKKVPKDRKVIVACQKGLRSLAASEQLSRAGYQNLAWINGGLQSAKKGDLPVTGADDIRMAGIGGMSSLLGWTEVQQENGKGFLGGSNNILAFAVLILALDGALFIYEQAKFFFSKQ